MYVSEVSWINKEINEAEVEVSDGVYSVLCFSHPFGYNIGDKIKENLHGFDVKDIMKVDTGVFYAEREDSTFVHIVAGKLCEECSVLSIGSIKINIEPDRVPKDLKDGDHIKVRISRIDIWS